MDDFVLGPCVVKPTLGEVVRGETVVRLRARVMDLLVFFCQHYNTVLSPERLLEGVWGTHFITHSALTRTLAELRSALGDDADRPWLLETIPKRGYRLLVAPKSVAQDDATNPHAAAGAAAGANAPRLWASIDGRSFGLDAGTHLLGRDKSAALRIDSPWVSRRHASITVTDNGATIADLGSRNGTFVNGRRVEAHAETPLSHGDDVRLGRSRVLIYRSSAELGTVADDG